MNRSGIFYLVFFKVLYRGLIVGYEVVLCAENPGQSKILPFKPALGHNTDLLASLATRGYRLPNLCLQLHSASFSLQSSLGIT